MIPGPPTVDELLTGGDTTKLFKLGARFPVVAPGTFSGTFKRFLEPLNGPML
jgi:hypothetical protein